MGGANVSAAAYTIDTLGSHVIKLTSTHGISRGGTVAGVGDVNGDGLADLAVSYSDSVSSSGGLHLVLGRRGSASGTQQSMSVDAFASDDSSTAYDDSSSSLPLIA